jgi:hypothetical protein
LGEEWERHRTHRPHGARCSPRRYRRPPCLIRCRIRAFHQIVQEQIGTQANWRDSGDLAMMYQGAFPTEFYRALAGRPCIRKCRGEPAGPVETAWEKVEQLRCACC